MAADADESGPLGGQRQTGRRGKLLVAVALVAVIGAAVLVQQVVQQETGPGPDHAGADLDGGRGAGEAARPGVEAASDPEPESEPGDRPEPEQAGELSCDPRPFTVVEEPPDGWEQLPPQPVVADGVGLVWTGQRLLQVGGHISEHTRDTQGEVFAYPPAGSDSGAGWQCLGPAPFAPGEVAAVASSEGLFVLSRGSAGVFQELTGRWLELPDAPFSHTPFTLAWTGEELIAWGNPPGTTTGGAIYDPQDTRWRPMADAPIRGERGAAVWTGEQLVVVAQGRAAAYDPREDVWTELAPSGLSPQAVAATVTDGVVVAYDYLLDAGYYDLNDGSWHELASPPLEAGECFPQAVTLDDGTVVLGYCGRIALLDPTSWSWQVLEVPVDDDGLALLGTRPVAVDGDLHLIAEGPHGRSDQHWRYRP